MVIDIPAEDGKNANLFYIVSPDKKLAVKTSYAKSFQGQSWSKYSIFARKIYKKTFSVSSY